MKKLSPWSVETAGQVSAFLLFFLKSAVPVVQSNGTWIVHRSMHVQVGNAGPAGVLVGSCDERGRDPLRMRGTLANLQPFWLRSHRHHLPLHSECIPVFLQQGLPKRLRYRHGLVVLGCPLAAFQPGARHRDEDLQPPGEAGSSSMQFGEIKLGHSTGCSLLTQEHTDCQVQGAQNNARR